jgi:hypothetical protein
MSKTLRPRSLHELNHSAKRAFSEHPASIPRALTALCRSICHEPER